MPEILSLIADYKSAPVSSSARVGILGEEIARRFLLKNGWRLVVANFKVPVGRNSVGAIVTGEIDIIALDATDTLSFVEVKTRSADWFAAPIAAVDLRKQRQITRAARAYRKIFNVQNVKHRYDVVSVVLGDENQPRVELFKNFWHESKFRKRSWAGDF